MFKSLGRQDDIFQQQLEMEAHLRQRNILAADDNPEVAARNDPQQVAIARIFHQIDQVLMDLQNRVVGNEEQLQMARNTAAALHNTKQAVGNLYLVAVTQADHYFQIQTLLARNTGNYYL